jgi:hypothetical protein
MGASPRGTVERWRWILDSLAALLFLAALAAPTIDTWVRPDAARSPEVYELRTPAPKPELPRTTKALVTYGEEYEAYFKDSFGLRDRLLRWNSMLEVFVYGVSPHHVAYFGRDGWLFYAADRSQLNHRGRHPFPPADLARWASALERKRALLAAEGVRYLYVVAPDKESIYPERLADWMAPVGPLRLDQWLAYMREHAPRVEILDLRPPLIAAKRDDTTDDWVYTNLGTHWNGRGARVAVRALSERLATLVPGFAPEVVDAFERFDCPDSGDSLTPRMYIGDLLVQRNHAYRPTATRVKTHVKGKFGIGRVSRSRHDDPALPRMILMHDSFGPSLEAGLAEQCSYLECRWSMELDLDEVVELAPDVVVDLYVERILNHLNPVKLVPSDGRRRPIAMPQ